MNQNRWVILSTALLLPEVSGGQLLIITSGVQTSKTMFSQDWIPYRLLHKNLQRSFSSLRLLAARICTSGLRSRLWVSRSSTSIPSFFHHSAVDLLVCLASFSWLPELCPGPAAPAFFEKKVFFLKGCHELQHWACSERHADVYPGETFWDVQSGEDYQLSWMLPTCK